VEPDNLDPLQNCPAAPDCPDGESPVKLRKTIRIDQLTPGMFVAGMDQPWYKTPYLVHHFLIKSEKEIAELKRYGVREVTIDPNKGLDLPDRPKETPESQTAADTTDAAESGQAALPQFKPSLSERELYREAETAVERVFDGLHAGQTTSVPAIKSVVGGMFDRILKNRTAMMTQVFLNQMRRFDGGLASHAIDTCIVSLIFATEFGLPPDDVERLGIGALLHDVGYVRLPRNLYRSRRELAMHEEELMRQHPRLGVTVLAKCQELPDVARHVVSEHHERVDGSGFPAGLSGGALSQAGQFVGLVDTYESLITHRAGRLPLSPFQAIRHLFMLGEKNTFDKAIVEVAIKCLGVYPIGSVVKLNTGERAIVVGIHPEHRLKPILKVILGPKGEVYASPVEVDLVAEQKAPIRSIVTALDPTTEQINVAMYLDNAAEAEAA